jgi:predicted nucleic acid-binding protein
MIYKKAFVDSDIILDLLLERDLFVDYSRALLTTTTQNLIKLYTSTLILANIHYVISKNVNKHVALNSLKFIINHIKILPFEALHLNLAISGEYADFEDSIQYYIAKQSNCDLIISRNIKHYNKFDIPVLTAEQLLRRIL